MSDCNLNGRPVLAGRIVLPRSGVWHAEVEVDGPDAATSGEVALAIGKQLVLRGTILRAGAFAGKATLRIVGGKGKLRTVLPAKDHAGAPLSVIVGDILTEAGESLSTTADADLLATVAAPAWSRTGGPAFALLARALADVGADVVWRVLPDGSVWVGRETWPATKGMADVVVLDHQHAEGRIEIVTEAPEVLPGMTFRGDRISSVEIAIEPERIRLDLLVEAKGAAGLDRLKAALVAIVEAVLGRRLDYLAHYAATVVTQHDTGLLDVVCDDARIGSLSYVPIKLGIPGASVKVAKDSQVMVTYEGGNPKRPIAVLWGDSTVDEISISGTKIKIGAGGQPAARQSDMVMMFGGALPNCQITLIGAGAGAGKYTAIVSNIVDPTGVLPVFGQISTGNPAVEE